jgi:hypothetical protein
VNPWASAPQPFPALQLSLVAHATRLEVAQFVARMAERSAVVHIVGQLRKAAHGLLVVRTQISASIVAAVSTAISIALKYRCPPSDIFRLASKAEVALKSAVTKGVMRSASRSPDMLAWTLQPAMLPTCPLGDWRGHKWSEIDDSFLLWILRKIHDREDVRFCAQAELDHREKERKEEAQESPF